MHNEKKDWDKGKTTMIVISQNDMFYTFDFPKTNIIIRHYLDGGLSQHRNHANKKEQRNKKKHELVGIEYQYFSTNK
ncbi:hypothetical protein CR513_57889, partial [Mucuna pruriens]